MYWDSAIFSLSLFYRVFSFSSKFNRIFVYIKRTFILDFFYSYFVYFSFVLMLLRGFIANLFVFKGAQAFPFYGKVRKRSKPNVVSS